MSFYAVANGRTVGVFTTWVKCNESVKGYKNALYKKFDTLKEAEQFIKPDIIFKPDYYVYTDGSCSNNGKSNARAGFGIYFGPNDSRNVSKRIEGKQTNNVAELTAIIETYPIIEEDIKNGRRITIMSDSLYAIRSITCSINDDTPNKELVQQAQLLYKNIPNIQLVHVKAHTNYTDIHSLGNEQADLLANQSL
jgi:ribonuclease HI